MFGGLLLGQFPMVDENVEDGDKPTAEARWGETPAVAQNCCACPRLEGGGGGGCCFQKLLYSIM